jgi:hypothetical protein
VFERRAFSWSCDEAASAPALVAAQRGGLSWTREQPNRPYIPDMIRIAISQAAFDAIALNMPLGSVGFENALAPNNECMCGSITRPSPNSASCAGRAIAIPMQSCASLNKSAPIRSTSCGRPFD